MTCEDLLRQMNEYVDGNHGPGVCDELRAHLENCSTCRVVIDNLRNTITIYKDEKPIELSAECRRKLHGLLREKWKQKFKDLAE